MHSADLHLIFVRRLTWAAVSQFEGRTVGGRPVYVRLRHGELSVNVGGIGAPLEDVVGGRQIYAGTYGDNHEFDITWPQVETETGLRCVGPVDDRWA